MSGGLHWRIIIGLCEIATTNLVAIVFGLSLDALLGTIDVCTK